MNWVDVTILTALTVSLLLGLYWGLIRQLAATFGLILAILLAGRFYEGVAGVLSPADGGGLIKDPATAQIVAFAGIAIGVSLAIGIISGIIRTVLNLIFLGWVDHLLGALLGVAQMLILIEAILVVATVIRVPNLSDTIDSSSLAGFLLRPLSFVVDLLPPEFKIIRVLKGW
jgi:membrane protein required for colicin V production